MTRALLTLCVIAAVLLELIDTTVVSVALPTIQGNLGADFTKGTWIVTAYVVANAIVIPINPWLQIRFGRRNYFIASIIVFTLASFMCGIANNLELLVAFRALQGLAGGGLLATGQVILLDAYPREEQDKAQGFLSIGVIMGPALGPIIGGWLTDNASWRWAFYINIPIGILATVLALAVIHDRAAPLRKAVDSVGALLLVVGLGSLQFVLGQGQLKDWFSDSTIVTSALLAAGGLVAFVVWELFYAREPIVDLRALAVREVWVGTLLSAGIGFVLYGFVIIVPQFATAHLGFTATLSGELFLIQAGACLVATPFSIVLFRRGIFQPRVQVTIGFVLFAAANWQLMHVETSTGDFRALVPALITSGIAISQLFLPVTLGTLPQLRDALVPMASAFQNLARQLGGSVSTAILASVQQRSATSAYAVLAEQVRVDRPGVAAFVHSYPDAARQLFSMVLAQASVLGFIATGSVAMCVALAIAPFALLLRRVDPNAPMSAGH